MTLKKKLAVSTLAVSMAAASVAGFPFSSKGLAQHLGVVGTASAATSDQDVLKSRINQLNAKLDANARKKLSDTRAEINTVIPGQSEFNTVFSDVLAKLNDPTIDKTVLFNLFKDLSNFYYDVDYSVIDNIRANQDYKNLFAAISAKAGVANLTTDDMVDFILGTETALRQYASSMTTSDLASIVLSGKVEETLLDGALDIVMNQKAGADGYKISQALDKLGITNKDISNSLDNLRTLLQTDKDSAIALALAYIDTFGLGYTPTSNTGGGIPSTTAPSTETSGVLNVASLVTVADGKATLKLVDADVLKSFDSLVAANSGKTNLTVSLDLGSVTAATVEAPISQAIIEAAKAKGIANIAIAVNGLTVTIPVGQFGAAVSLSITTAADSSVTSITSLKLASKVYDFGLTVGGVATTTFKQPLTIKLPLNEVSGLDKELLSVAKIVDGKLLFQGGVVEGNYIVEPRDTFSSYATVENKVNFNDIANVQAWAGRQIQVVAAKGAIEGIGEGKFAPKSNVTRAEFAKMLIRALNLENSTATQKFGDVSASAWYAPYVAVAAEKGIITGRNASTFDPNATITRAEMATMIARAVKVINPSAKTDASALNKFADAAKISSSLKDGVAFAASNNLVIGSAGKFNPNNTATRAEAAVIIYRTINFK